MNKIELVRVGLSEEYAKKWNVHSSDFYHIYKNGKKVSDTLYRTGSFEGKVKNKYFMMLKHVEAHYEDSITKDKNRKPHLESQWCIIDNNGVEKVNFKQFASVYLQGGVIYVIDDKYYNIETGYLYCKSYKSMHSGTYLFLDNAYDDDKSKRGVLKIHKEDGTYELIK